MGTTGARQFASLIVFSLTQSNKISSVAFKLTSMGSHFGPGIYTREDFNDFEIVNNLPPTQSTRQETPLRGRGCF